MRLFLSLSIVLISIVLAGQVQAAETSYGINYNSAINTLTLQYVCDEQIKNTQDLSATEKIRAIRFTYCSSASRWAWVQKFIHHLENDGGYVGNATEILLSDSLILDTILGNPNTIRTTDSGWFVLWAYATAREQDTPATIVGIIEKRSEKDPKQRYRFFELSLRSDFAGENEIYVRTTLIPITNHDITPYKKGRYFYGTSFREYIINSFREGKMKNSWYEAFGTFINAE